MILNFELVKKLFDIEDTAKDKIDIYIPIAISRCEHYCRLNLTKKQETEILENPPEKNTVVILPKYPVIRVLSVRTKGENAGEDRDVDYREIDYASGKICFNENIGDPVKIIYEAGYDADGLPKDLGYHVLQYAAWLCDNARNAGMINADVDGVASYAVEQGIPKVIRQVFSAYQRGI